MPQECRNRASFKHRLIAVHGLHGMFEAHLRRNLALHISCFYWSSWWPDSARNSRSTANETFGTLVGGFQACQCARKFERDPRDVFPRESGGRSCTRDVTQPQNLRTSKTRKKGRHTHCVLSSKNDILLYYTNYKQKTVPTKTICTSLIYCRFHTHSLQILCLARLKSFPLCVCGCPEL